MSRCIVIGFILVIAGLISANQLPAQDFRIDTKVYVNDSKQPAFENVTLFQRGVVYDFLNQPATEITIYDPRGRHFTLLDIERQVKTRIEEDVLLQFVAQVKARALERGGPTIREAAAPQFRVDYDDSLRRVTLNGKRIDYVGQSGTQRFPNADAANEYYSFIDLYTRLNATRPGAMPPHARLALNDALAVHEILPEFIERTLRTGNPLLGKAVTARSEHTVVWKLLRRDQVLIDHAANQRANFTAVSFGQFRNLPPQPLPKQ